MWTCASSSDSNLQTKLRHTRLQFLVFVFPLLLSFLVPLCIVIIILDFQGRLYQRPCVFLGVPSSSFSFHPDRRASQGFIVQTLCLAWNAQANCSLVPRAHSVSFFQDWGNSRHTHASCSHWSDGSLSSFQFVRVFLICLPWLIVLHAGLRWFHSTDFQPRHVLQNFCMGLTL